MRNASNDRDDTVDQAQAFGRRHEIEICIPNAGFEVIEKAGQITLSGDLRAETEDVLNSYIRHTGWDRNARPSKETKAHLRLFGKQLEGMLNTLDHVNRKLTGESQYHPGIALLDQRLFHHAGISPTRFCGMLQSLKKELENKGTESARVGRPKNFFLAQFF